MGSVLALIFGFYLIHQFAEMPLLSLIIWGSVIGSLFLLTTLASSGFLWIIPAVFAIIVVTFIIMLQVR